MESVRSRVPEDLRARLVQRLLPAALQHQLASRAFRDRYDWSRTRAFPLPTWTAGYISVNQAGREALGIVPPTEAPAVIDEVVALLRATVDADTGKPLVREVLIGDALFGRRAPGIPDVMAVWAADGPVRRVRHPTLGEWSGDPSIPRYRFSVHRDGGQAIFAGPSFRKARPAGARAAIDLAPTFLALAGVRPPTTMAGQPWTDLLR
jgi:predicted AlkP superfamily phosphohydrolase/phosphomutase